ncbi:MAG TPA: L,D-transpeptidase family protein [Gaiellaceae bacterium]|nr:L,D-transpeptidase family protein [Gaiellaceae bacterium]
MAALAATAAAPAAPASCRADLASGLAATGKASQVVTVVAAGTSSTTGTMLLWRQAGGCWAAAGGPWSVYLGFAGVSTDHNEGDGTTPEGAFAVSPTMYGVAPDPGVHFGYHRLVCGDWWDEDPASSAYNTFQHVACGTKPSFGGSSEALWRSTVAYAHFAFLDYNVGPAVPGRGSAIFVHVEIGHPTNGCISLPEPRLVRLLRWLRPGDHPLFVIGTAASIRSY